MTRWSLVAAVWLLVLSSCTPAVENGSETRPAGGPLFRDAAVEASLQFQHFNGAGGALFLPEIMGAGVVLFDYDGDGDLDVYAVQGGPFDSGGAKKPEGHEALLANGDGAGNRLFRNEQAPSGQLHFTDVTRAAGVGHEGFGMGAAVGEIDNDGDLDLYVTNFGPNVLYRNNGDGTFSDVTAEAGVGDDRWSTSAAFLDYDRDGRLDLFVAHYVDFTIRGNIPCYGPTGVRDYCNPSVYQPLPDRLFRNRGGGRFVDVSADAGIQNAFGSGLGVVCSDFDGNGWPDIFVANDGNENQLWMNQGDGTFLDAAMFSGTAFNSDGMPEAGMGVTAGDFDQDGDADLFLTHLVDETHTLYVNDGQARFSDETLTFGLSQPLSQGTGFGTQWFDYNNDGWLDLFVANGGVRVVETVRRSSYPYRQRSQLFGNETGRGFGDVSSSLGIAWDEPQVGRGAAFGDVDNDGDIDIVVSNNGGPLRLLLNETAALNHWVMVRLESASGDFLAGGAKVTLFRQGHRPLVRLGGTDGSYLSAGDSRLHFGLGKDPTPPERIVVQWPDGAVEELGSPPADTVVHLRQGSVAP